jgi:iron(II)-dependent oxidoreductase
MAGNVAEWVNDFYAWDYYATGPEKDPQGPAEGSLRVARGGGYLEYLPLSLRANDRLGVSEIGLGDPYDHMIGFRCAKTVK